MISLRFVTCIAILFFLPLISTVSITHIQAGSPNPGIVVGYSSDSTVINSSSTYGTISLFFGWKSQIGTTITYNGTSLPYRECLGPPDCRLVFTNLTGSYSIGYFLPVRLYEYLDQDGDGLFTGSHNATYTTAGPDILVAGYKIDLIVAMTNVTFQGETAIWSLTLLVLPMKQNVGTPWEQYPTLTELFHYFTFNGTMKMDILIHNFQPQNSASRIYLSYGINYANLKGSGPTPTIYYDNQEIQPSEVGRALAVGSNQVEFVVGNRVTGFFDFGRKVVTDGQQGVVLSEIGPVDVYWVDVNKVWLSVGLNYPHVSSSLEHDPYFGMLNVVAPARVNTLVIAGMALVGVVILSGSLYSYRQTKRRTR